VLLALFGVFLLGLIQLHATGIASADTANTINFQARLQNSTSGIVPDGDYNIEFKLYDDPTLSGSHLLWTEDYLNSAGHGLQTVNGYFSTALGSVTAFPGTIDWSQKLWLTMNVGGTTTDTVTWDGEMNPRLPLTAVPYAFRAAQAATASKADKLSNVSNGNTSELVFQGSASGHGDQSFVIQDQGTAGTYNLLTKNQADSSYIQLQTGTITQQTGTISISGEMIAGSISTGSVDTAAAGTIIIGGTNATGVSFGNGSSNIATTINGTLLVKPTNGHDSATAFQVQNGAGLSLLKVDSTTGTITFGNGGNTVAFTAAGGMVASGTAQHQKRLTLSPEYAGAVFDAVGDTACTAANSGSLTSGYDTGTRNTYYNWTSSQTTTQCYDVIVRVALPSDFSSWAGTDPISVRAVTDNTSNSSVAIAVLDAAGTADGNYDYTSGSLGTSWGDVATSGFASSNYSAGDTVVLKLRLSAKSGANLKLGDIVLTYNSSF